MKELLWTLATKNLKSSDWKKLAIYWTFTADHIRCIEHQYTGTEQVGIIILFWRCLTKWLIWYLSQPFIRFSLSFSSNGNNARILSWNQSVLSNAGKVSCIRKQREPLFGVELTNDRLQVWRATHCVSRRNGLCASSILFLLAIMKTKPQATVYHAKDFFLKHMQWVEV